MQRVFFFQGSKIHFAPSTLYRGFGLNLLSIAPITAFQVASSSMIYRSLFVPRDYPVDQLPPPPTISQNIISSGTAGALSGLLAAPCESIVLHQQQTGLNMKDTFRYTTEHFGVKSIFRGATWAALRDCPFTVCYLALGPYFSTHIQQDCQTSEPLARLLGGLAAGVISAIVTHPFDTVKTRLQHDFKKERFPTTWSAVRAGNLYQGVSARGARVIIGTCIISNASDLLNKFYQKWKIEHFAAQQSHHQQPTI